MAICCNVTPPIPLDDAMAAIARALAPEDSETQKEWTCVSFSGCDSSRGDELHDLVWESRKSAGCSLMAVEWSFLQLLGGEWVDCKTVVVYSLNAETVSKITIELEKCLK